MISRVLLDQCRGIASQCSQRVEPRNSRDVYAFVLAHVPEGMALTATSVAKMAVIVYSVMDMVTVNERRSFVPRIYLYGPYPSGNSRTLHAFAERRLIDRDLFRTRGGVVATAEGRESFQKTCDEFRMEAPEAVDTIAAIVRALAARGDDLDSLIDVAYSITLDRGEILSQNIAPHETGRDVVLAALAHNARQLELAGVFPQPVAIDLPRSSALLRPQDIVDENGTTCLKSGTNNKLLALLAIAFLRSRGQRTGAHNEYLLSMLSSRHLRATVTSRRGMADEKEAARRERDQYAAEYQPALRELVDALFADHLIEKVGSTLSPTVSVVEYGERRFDIISKIARVEHFYDLHVKSEG